MNRRVDLGPLPSPCPIWLSEPCSSSSPQAIRAIEKAPPRTIPDADALATKMHYVLNMHERGGSQDAEGILQVRANRQIWA